MNIAMFTNVYKPFVGGVPISIDRLSTGLKENGNNVYIFAPEYPNENSDEDVIRCKVIAFYANKKFDIPVVNIFSKNIKHQFADLDVDIVHVHHPFWMGSLGAKLAKAKNIPLVFTYHTRYEEYLHNIPFSSVFSSKNKTIKIPKAEAEKGGIYVFKNYVKYRVVPKYINGFIKKCDGVFMPTASMSEWVGKLPCPTYILPTGLDKDCFHYDEQRAAAIRAEKRQDKKYLLVTVSRITKEKNIEFMIDAMRILKQKIGDVFRLMVIGSGDLMEELKQKCVRYEIADNVEFVGQVENDQLSNYYRASDLFVFSSLSETQGIVLLEAMAQRCPVVAVNATGVRDIVVDGMNGYLSEQNKNQWCRKVIAALQDEKMEQQAYATSMQYKNTRIARQAEDIYQQTIERFFQEGHHVTEE